MSDSSGVKPASESSHCSCAHHPHHDSTPSSRGSAETDAPSAHGAIFESPMHDQVPFPPLEQTASPPQMEQVRKRSTLPPSTYSSHVHNGKERAATSSSERGRSPVRSMSLGGEPSSPREDAGGRRRFQSRLVKVGEFLGTAEKGLFDDSGFREGPAGTYYPTVPGEQFKNPTLRETEEKYQHTLEENERRARSRAPSFVGSVEEDGRAVSPSPSVGRPRRSSTMGYQSRSTSPTSPTSPPHTRGIPGRSASLTVPGPAYLRPSTRQPSSPTTGALFVTVPEGEPSEQSPISPPAIVVSADPETMSVIDEPVESPDTPSPSPTRPPLGDSPR